MRSAPLPRLVRWLLAGIGLAAAGDGLVFPFLVVYFHQGRHVPLNLAELALMGAGIAGIAVTPLVGRMVDRLGALRVLSAGIFISALATLGLIGVTTAWQALVVEAVAGVGQAAYWPASATVFGRLASGRAQERLYGMQYALLNAGLGIGGLVGGATIRLAAVGTFQRLFVADAAVLALFGLGLVLVRARLAQVMVTGSPLGAATDGAIAHADPPGLLGVESGPGRDEPSARVPVPSHAAAPQTSASSRRAEAGYKTVLRMPGVALLAGMSVLLVTVGYGQLEAGAPVYETVNVHGGPALVGWSFAVNTAVIVVGQLGVVAVVRRRSRARVLALTGGAWAACWLLFIVAGRPGLPEPARVSLVLVAFAVFGIGEMVWFPVSQTLVNELTPAALQGRAHAVTSMAWQVGTIFGPALAASLLGAGHPIAWLTVLVVGCLAAAGMGWVLGRDVERRAGRVGGDESAERRLAV